MRFRIIRDWLGREVDSPFRVTIMVDPGDAEEAAFKPFPPDKRAALLADLESGGETAVMMSSTRAEVDQSVDIFLRAVGEAYETWVAERQAIAAWIGEGFIDVADIPMSAPAGVRIQ